MSKTHQTVGVKDLQDGMVIQEVLELSFDYGALDKASLQFLQTYFKGAKALVTSSGTQKTVGVAELAPFDSVEKLLEIPADLKASTVVPGLAASLEKKGLLRFKVIVPEGAPAAAPDQETPKAPGVISAAEKQKKDAARREEAKSMLEKIEHGDQIRSVSCSVVEEMMDLGRQGKFTKKGVEAAVEEIVAKGSTPAMKALAGLRGSDQTYAHCVDMSVILQDCYANVLQRQGKPVEDAVNRFTLVSGFMHDIGKSEVPKDILESTERFDADSKEMLTLRNHTTYGAKILSDMSLHPTTINVAHYHHVKIDKSLFTSYPEVSYEEVHPLTRLASIVDVYQALIGKRKYKKNWVPGLAVAHIQKISKEEFDPRLLGAFLSFIGVYPLGSLVKLSTGDLAFVVAQAEPETPTMPTVALVETASGERLTSTTLINLETTPDITITDVVDHYEHYNASEDEAFEIFRSIQV